MNYKYLLVRVNKDESSYDFRLRLPRKKYIKIEDVYIQYDWDEEGIFLIEWTNRTFPNYKEMYAYFYSFNRILSFLYGINIGLIDDERIFRFDKFIVNEEYVGSNKNVLNIKKFYSKYRSIDIKKKKEFDECINLLNKSSYFNLELGLEEEAYIYLYKIIEIIANKVVDKTYINNNLEEVKNDFDLESIIKKYLCKENCLEDYPDIIAAVKNKIKNKYSEANIKIYHLNLNIKPIVNIGSIDSIREIVSFRNVLSHANPTIDDREKFDKAFSKLHKYVPELICKYYFEENFKDMECKLHTIV